MISPPLPQTVSEVTELRFCSLPEAPTNLSLEARYLVPAHRSKNTSSSLSRFPNSLTVRWEAPGCQATSSSHKYRLTVESAAGAVLLTPDCTLSNTCVQGTGLSTP